MPKKKTHEEYVNELKIKNPNIEVIGNYINANTKIKHRCLIHNISWDVTPDGTLHGSGCKECKSSKISKHQSKTHEEYVKELNDVNPNIIVVEKYVNSNTPILHRCKIDNYEWEILPSSILYQGCGCPKCGIEKSINLRRKTNEQYIEELKKSNKNIIALEKYINAYTPILHKCLIDGNEWYASPANILYSTGCPQCNFSYGENKIKKWLDNNNIEYLSQKRFNDCKDIRSLPFDFYLPNNNACIEYDGEQHYKPIDFFGGQASYEKTVKHDNIKNQYCKDNGIHLLRIPYYKYNNIEEELNNFLFI